LTNISYYVSPTTVPGSGGLNSINRTTTNSTTPAVKAQLTFTPAANTAYEVLIDGWADLDTNSVAGYVDLVDTTGKTWFTLRWRADSSEQSGAAIRPLPRMVVVPASASPVAITLQLRYYMAGAGNTNLGLRNCRLIAWALGPNDLYAVSDNTDTTTATSYQTKLALTLAAGRYLVCASAGAAITAGTPPGAHIGLNLAASTVSVLDPVRSGYATGTTYLPWRAWKDYTATAGDQAAIVWRADSGDTAGCRNAYITARLVSDLPEFWSAESAADSNTPSTSYADKTSLAVTAAAAPYLILESATVWGTVGSATIYSLTAKQTLDGADQDVIDTYPYQSGQGTQQWSHGSARVDTLTAASHTYKTRFAVSNVGLTPHIQYAGLYAVRLQGGAVQTVTGADLGAATDSGTFGKSGTVDGRDIAQATASASIGGGHAPLAGVEAAVAFDAGLIGVTPAVVGGRGASAAWQAEAQRTSGARPIRFFYGDFGARGELRCWTGYSDRTWQDVPWYGSGELIQVTAPKESTDRSRNGVTVTLSGADQAGVRSHVQDAMLADIHGRKAMIYDGWLDDLGNLIVDPVCVFAGCISSCTIAQQDDGGYMVQVQIEQELRDLDRASKFRINAASQVAIDAEDKGLEFLATIGSLKVQWGPRYYNEVKEP
jgi:hypothetical protein